MSKKPINYSVTESAIFLTESRDRDNSLPKKINRNKERASLIFPSINSTKSQDRMVCS